MIARAYLVVAAAVGSAAGGAWLGTALVVLLVWRTGGVEDLAAGISAAVLVAGIAWLTGRELGASRSWACAVVAAGTCAAVVLGAVL